MSVACQNGATLLTEGEVDYGRINRRAAAAAARVVAH
jgi:hypothetical protein